MKKIVLVMLFFVNNCMSQYKTIDNTDTIYIEYHGVKSEIKEIKLNKDGGKNNIYRLKKFNLLLIQLDTNSYTNSQYRFIEKKYKKKIKEKTLNYNFFSRIKNSDTLQSLIKKLKLKKVYIIDYTEKNKGQIPIYPVKAFFTAYKPALE